MLVGAEAEVPDSLAAVLGATQDQGVAAGGGTESQLIKGDGLTAGGDDAGAGGGSEPESGNSDLGEGGVQAVVVSDGADHDDGPLLALLVDVGDDARQGDGRAVDLGHKQASEDDLVERGVGAACRFAASLDILERTGRVRGAV